MKNLFICLTPLQMIICLEIIHQKKIKEYGLICLFLTKSDKYQYYFDKIKKDSLFSYAFYPKEKVIGIQLLLDVFIFKRKIAANKNFLNIENLYIASIDNRYVQVIFSILKYKKLYTFDDGLANLNYDGSYYRNEELSFSRRVLWHLVGVSFLVQNIRDKVKMHYTIYNDKKNIVSNTEYISLLDKRDFKANSKEGVEYSFFLGQPLYEVDKICDDNYINSLLSNLDVDFYFPHPRENYKISSSIKVVYTKKIFEDYIKDFINEKNVKKIKIYTFFSTAVLNLAEIDSIELFVIHDPKIMDIKLLNLFKQFSVNFIDWDSL
ncbi:MAG: glycosyltransferase family 52 [Acinetobacter calcoaceticus]